jgi:thymidine phosphorylase
MERMVAAQGGDARVVRKPELLAQAEVEVAVKADRSGFVRSLDALELGLTAVAMGAGRTRADQAVDHGVGIHLERKPGQAVRAGEVLAVLRVRKESDANVARVLGAFSIGDECPAEEALVISRIDGTATES